MQRKDWDFSLCIVSVRSVPLVVQKEPLQTLVNITTDLVASKHPGKESTISGFNK